MMRKKLVPRRHRLPHRAHAIDQIPSDIGPDYAVRNAPPLRTTPRANDGENPLLEAIETGVQRTRKVTVRGDLVIRGSARMPKRGVVAKDGRHVWSGPK